MTWAVLTTEDVLGEFTLQEAYALRALQGSGSGSGMPLANMDLIVIGVVDEVRGYISAGGYALDDTSDPRTIPLSLFEDAKAIARWRILIAVPSFPQLQTEPRRQAFEDALKKLALVAQQKFVIDPPVDPTLPTAGLWNSENKIIMRSHPIPRPGAQFMPQTNT